jgi:diacylglycerol O-acyltransferase / wax synthase
VRENRPHVDRPTALDLAFLDLETPQAPLHVGWTLRFAGAAPPAAALRRHLDARLGAVPRFRRRLVRVAPDVPVWADDPGFDVARHVFGVTLRGELRELAGTLLSAPLPADRPLWRMYLVEGLPDGGFAIVGQAHHALIDGVAAIQVAQLLFGPQADDAGVTWTPAPPPSAGAALGASAITRGRALAGVARAAWSALAPDGTSTPAERASAVLRAGDALVAPPGGSDLERSATARRAIAYADAELDAVRAAGRAGGATINDVLLTATAMALRAALRRRGERRETLRALVPVSVRSGDDPTLGNRITFLPIALPVGEPDAHRALALVAARTAAAKAGGDAGALDALARAADALPGPGRRLIARGAARALPFTLVVSNVPGPPVALSLLGRELRAVHPMVPLLDGHALTVGGVSYDGRLHVGVAADAEVVPDAAAIARDLEDAFGALAASARRSGTRDRTATPRTPGRARPRRTSPGR